MGYDYTIVMVQINHMHGHAWLPDFGLLKPFLSLELVRA